MIRLPPRSTLFPYTTLFRSYEWTDLAYQQLISGNTGLLVFPLCVLFVFLVLAAQYESLSYWAASTRDRKSTRLNSSHRCISYAVFCLKKKKDNNQHTDVLHD